MDDKITIRMTNERNERDEILSVLGAFARSKPGLEPGNYGSRTSYRSDSRAITRDLRHAETLLAAVRWRTGITAEHLRAAFRAFGGRLSWDAETRTLDYCVGQYCPTEYRRAVCAVCAQALWDHFRAEYVSGKAMRETARREFGPTVATRWFT